MVKQRSLAVIIMLSLGIIYSGCEAIPAGSNREQNTVKKSGNIQEQGNLQVPFTKEVIAKGLDVPWELAAAPDGRLFFTERSGALRVIEEGKLLKEPVLSLKEGLYQKSEAGLLGLALDPNFGQNHYMYVYQSYVEGNQPLNRVLRLVERNNKAKLDKVIFGNLPASQIHDGGRIKFGPDGMLYVTNGDSSSPSHAQDVKKLSGKIFRIHSDGTIPADNPFPGSPVYSLGHRNPQGLAWHPLTGKLYSSEHGQTAHDEINLIEAGANYGWPLIQGEVTEVKPADAASKGPGKLKVPILQSGDETWAPSGITFVSEGPWKHNLLVANLRGTQLQRMVLASDGQSVQSVEVLFHDEFGRIRDVVEGPDGSLYMLTNNRDGRGIPGKDDDRIIRLKPSY
jgi:glucose/arabinose dehydrogenase